MFVTLHIMLATSFGKAMALLVVCLAWAVALQWFVYKRCRPVGTKLTDDELKRLDPFDLITLQNRCHRPLSEGDVIGPQAGEQRVPDLTCICKLWAAVTLRAPTMQRRRLKTHPTTRHPH